MKKLRVMVDINVILDVLENRNGWVMDAAKTCAVCGGGMRAIGFVPPHAVTTIYYIVRKRGGKALADKAIDWLLALFKVADCGTDEFKAARASGIDDYEDAVVVASAQKEVYGNEIINFVIIQRLPSDFCAHQLPVFYGYSGSAYDLRAGLCHLGKYFPEPAAFHPYEAKAVVEREH